MNVCKLCHEATLVQQGKEPLKVWEWKEVVEKKAIGVGYGSYLGANKFCAECGSISLQRAEARKTLADAAQEKQEGMPGQWQHESPFKEVVVQVKRSADTDCGPQTMRRAYNAKMFGN